VEGGIGGADEAIDGALDDRHRRAGWNRGNEYRQ
jgi:hypothetical protein